MMEAQVQASVAIDDGGEINKQMWSSAPSTTEMFAQQHKRYRKQKCLWYLVLGGLFIAAVTLIGILVPSYLSKDNNKDKSKEEEGGDSEATKDDHHDREAYFNDLVEMFDLSLMELSVAQNQALEWMSFQDDFVLDLQEEEQEETIPTIDLWQRFALVVFYYSQADVERWESVHSNDPGSGWISYGTGMHECQWEGIHCDDDYKVIEISLPTPFGLRSTGIVTTELGKLTNLHHLGLSNHRLEGSIPSEWKNLLENLVILDLSGNLLSSTIPDWIGDSSTLKVLGLGKNKLEGPLPSTLRQLTQLEKLDLLNNEGLSGALEDFFPAFENLQYLDITSTLIGGSLSSLVGEKKNSFDSSVSSPLQVLAARSAPLHGSIPAGWMSTLGNLERFVIGDGDLTGSIPTEIGLATNLQELVINRVLKMDYGDLPSEIGLLTKLTVLDFNWSNRQGTLPLEYKNLSNLVSLDLRNNAITGSFPEQYSQMTSLNFVDVTCTQLTGEIDESVCAIGVQKFHANCEIGNRFHLACDCCMKCVTCPFR